MILNFKYGFYYKERLFVWNNKILYRYPFISKNRSYPLKEVKIIKGNYRLCREWVSLNKVKELTSVVSVKEISIIKDDKHLPF
jgi:hypothetical protein